uniref:(R)-linalool synthase n=1 Tax=Magnolia champaca TaxID=86757 RepID=A0A1Y0BW36_MAGCH|nr:(R)-linalool synthase [Magnolia champaca]
MDFLVQSPPFSSVIVPEPFQLQRIQIRWRSKWTPLARSTVRSKPCMSKEILRRSANYHPAIWCPQQIESLTSPYTDRRFVARLEELKIDIKRLIKKTVEPSDRLKLVDLIQRLGIGYHFEKEMKEGLDDVYVAHSDYDLCSAALRFRLLRQHGYEVTPDIFNDYKDEEGKFKAFIKQDAHGLLSLYEASYLGMHEEGVLDEAMEFSRSHLKGLMGSMDSDLTVQVQHAFEIPMHWRMPRLEAKHYIDVYERENRKSLVLLELAKLDFNLVQSKHQHDLKELSRWWRELGLAEKLPFSRDRLVENYVWAMGIASEPQFSKCRIAITKLVSILTVIDDMYDVYGSLDELELFTEAVERWDIKDVDVLPDYMKICYLALYNFANEITYDTLKDHGCNVLPFIKKEWQNLCKAYLVEAKWFSNGYTPTLDEYLMNGWISVGGPVAMVHAYFLQGCPITKELIDQFMDGSDLIYWSSLITRLSDDLGTSEAEMKRGDVPKAIQCRMKETGVSHESAQGHIKGLMSDAWKRLNEECLRSSLPKTFVDMVLNMARTAQCIFEHGDGIGTSKGVTRDRIITLFNEPILI